MGALKQFQLAVALRLADAIEPDAVNRADFDADRIEPHAVLVALTNQGQSENIEQVKALGVNGYIVKASTIPSEVVSMVERIAKK